MNRTKLLLTVVAIFFSVSLFAQTSANGTVGSAGFYVKSYQNGDFLHVGGATVYLGKDKSGKKLGTFYKIQSCNSDLGDGLIKEELKPGEYQYYAESGDGRQIWKGSFRVEPNKKTRICLPTDFSKYTEVEITKKQ